MIRVSCMKKICIVLLTMLLCACSAPTVQNLSFEKEDTAQDSGGDTAPVQENAQEIPAGDTVPTAEESTAATGDRYAAPQSPPETAAPASDDDSADPSSDDTGETTVQTAAEGDSVFGYKWLTEATVTTVPEEAAAPEEETTMPSSEIPAEGGVENGDTSEESSQTEETTAETASTDGTVSVTTTAPGGNADIFNFTTTEYITTAGVTDSNGNKLDKNGVYTALEDVTAYIRKFSALPGNFISAAEAEKKGWKQGEDLWKYAEGKSVGGDDYKGNMKGLAKGSYKYCYVNYSGGEEMTDMLVYSGKKIYHTTDGGQSFELIYDADAQNGAESGGST